MPMPEMQDVNSSSIASVGYDAESHTVYVGWCQPRARHWAR